MNEPDVWFVNFWTDIKNYAYFKNGTEVTLTN
jgi:hypothetical protein